MGADSKERTTGDYHAVSCSGGKDSTAMLLLMIERDMPIDVVLTADTGMEFPEMYEHMQKLDGLLYRERGIHITTLRHPKGFEWLMFEEPKVKQSSIENRQRLGVSLYGNGWPGARVRWCTGQLKTHLIHKEVNRLKKSGTPCTMSGSPPTSRSASKTTNIPWWLGASPRLKPCRSVMTGALTGADCIGYTTAAPAGAAPSNESGS